MSVMEGVGLHIIRILLLLYDEHSDVLCDYVMSVGKCVRKALKQALTSSAQHL